MKRIFLLRHAKSSWDDYSLRDFDRPLAKRGVKAAKRMGVFFRNQKIEALQIISSTAKRAKQTTELFCNSADIKSENIEWSETLYYGGAQDYLKQIRYLNDESLKSVLLVGHNPMMESTASLLIDESQESTFIMPTAALLMFSSDAYNWGDITAGSCELKWMITPKIIKKLVG